MKPPGTHKSDTGKPATNKPWAQRSHDEQMRAIREARQRRLAGLPVEMPEAPGKTRVQAVLGALPVLMLVIGLVVFYRNEAQQSSAAPIMAETRTLEGRFKGLSTMSGDRLYLWLITDGQERGVRVHAARKTDVQNLDAGQLIRVQAAPTQAGSQTLWLMGFEALPEDNE